MPRPTTPAALGVTQSSALWSGSSALSRALAAVISPSVFQVELNKLDLSEGVEVQELDPGLDMERVLSGEVSSKFVD